MKDTDKNKYPVKNIVLFTLNASYLHTSLAVSYTHLDVYKRQV